MTAPDMTTAISWRQAFSALGARPVLRMLFLGFSAGLPLLLIFSTLSVWLREAGVSRSAVTFFSWAALGYSFKFIWAPLVDRLELGPLTARLGRRRGWLLASQILIACAMIWVSLFDPQQGPASLGWLAAGAVVIGFASATQDIVIDAYRIETATPDLQSMMAATYMTGYRIGMLAAGAGALWIASAAQISPDVYDPLAWALSYRIMAALMLVGIVTTLVIAEPNVARAPLGGSLADQGRFFLTFLIILAAMITAFMSLPDFGAALAQALGQEKLGPAWAFLAETVRFLSCVSLALAVGALVVWSGLARPAHLAEMYFEPMADFLRRYGRAAILILALVGIYRISDLVMGTVANTFYVDTGFSKDEIAFWSKTFGLWMSILGGFLGGILALRFGILPMLLAGAVMAALSNLLFVGVHMAGPDQAWLAVAITGDNLAGGIASGVFVAYLSSLTNIRFTAMQYALFSSLMTLLPKILGGYAGSMVDSIGYAQFFILTALLSLPVTGLILLLWRSERRRT